MHFLRGKLPGGDSQIKVLIELLVKNDFPLSLQLSTFSIHTEDIQYKSKMDVIV